jgi:hypothetical protein
MAKAEEGIPFVLEYTHHGSVKRRSIAGTEGHDSESILLVVRAKEGEFGLVRRPDDDLVVAGFVVKTDEEESAGRVSKVVNGIIASGNGVFKREGDLVEATIRNTHTPNKVRDIGDLFLMRFGG